MRDVEFTEEELAEFRQWYDRMPSWTGWSRRRGEHGEDVIEIEVVGSCPRTLKLARSPEFGYLATGFDGWALTVCDEFAELLGILSNYRSSRADTEQAGRVVLSMAG